MVNIFLNILVLVGIFPDSSGNKILEHFVFVVWHVVYILYNKNIFWHVQHVFFSISVWPSSLKSGRKNM